MSVIPAYKYNGGIATGVDYSVAVPYPATVDADDILLVCLLDADNDDFDTPSGWAKIDELTSDPNVSFAWYWKRATGSETGSVTFTSTLNAGNLVAGVMASFGNCVTSGTPYDTTGGPARNGVSRTTVEIAYATIGSVTTQGPNRLVVAMIGLEDNTGISEASNYSEKFDVSTTVGDNGEFSFQTQAVASAGVVGEETATIGGLDYWGTLVLALIGHTLTAEGGSFVITGSDAALEKQHKVSVESGSFALTVSDAALKSGKLSVEPGAFNITGGDASLFRSFFIYTESGSFVLAGMTADLKIAEISAFTASAIDNPHVDIIRLVEITIGSTTLYLCDRVFGDDSLCTFNGQLYEPLIIAWGTIKCGRIDPISYAVEPGNADFTVDNSQPVGGADCFTALFIADDPQYCSVIISEIHAGATAAPDKEDIFGGHIEDLPEMTVDRVTVACGGFELDIVNRFIHTIVDDTTYPGADPDDIGKMVPQIYGSVKRVPCIAADAGGKTTIAEDMTDTSPGNSGTLAVSDASALPSSGAFIIQIDAEQVSIASRSGNTLTLAASGARGYSTTDAADHDLGAPMAEIQTKYVYLVADHPVKEITTVYVDSIRQASGFTAYTGQTGSEYTGYSGKAVIVFDALPNYKKQVNIEADSSALGVDSSGRGVGDSGHSHSSAQQTITWYFDTAIQNIATVSNPSNICDQNLSNWAWFGNQNAQAKVDKAGAESYSGPPQQYRICVRVGTIQTGVTIQNTFYGAYSKSVGPTHSGTTQYGAWSTAPSGADTWTELKSRSAYVTQTYGNNGGGICEIWLEVKYTPAASVSGTADVSLSGTAAVSGTVSLTGNSTAETVIGQMISVDGQGYLDDGSGTYTDTPNALIERPDHQSKHIIIDRCGLSADEIHATSYTVAGTFFNTNSFTLGFPILQRPNVRLLLNRIATQAKAMEFWEAGKHHIVPIEDSPSMDKAIDDNRVDLGQIWVKYTDRINIKNKLTASYSRQWSGHIDEVEADRAIVIASDSDSITKFGTLQGDPFSFPYINGETQAQAMLNWKLADSKGSRLIVEHGGGYYLTDIKRGDILRFDNRESVGDNNDWLENALLGLVTMGSTLFRVIDKDYRPDAAIQIKVVKI